uniref:Wings apart-like protein C-terminal domain-containing protein n=1 Tax=Quercus lobata TaxID=97700 RepID=A0A7N2R4B3_QUELO
MQEGARGSRGSKEEEAEETRNFCLTRSGSDLGFKRAVLFSVLSELRFVWRWWRFGRGSRGEGMSFCLRVGFLSSFYSGDQALAIRLWQWWSFGVKEAEEVKLLSEVCLFSVLSEVNGMSFWLFGEGFNRMFMWTRSAHIRLMEVQEFGEMMEHVDEVNFALDGLRKPQPVRIRRASLLSLLSICATVQQRRLLRTQGEFVGFLNSNHGMCAFLGNDGAKRDYIFVRRTFMDADGLRWVA